MRVLLYLQPFLVVTVTALHYDPAFLGYNLNENQSATEVLDYWGEWTGHTYQPSPANWRFPIYTLFLDRLVDGDPTNNDINGTVFETDSSSNQYRFGGDLKGLEDTLDYIQGMGIRGIYIAGTPFMNVPWKSDGYSPVDLSLLDQHFGDLDTWRTTIDNIHARGMYVIMDNTVGTMADFIGYQGALNMTAPLVASEYDAIWKGDRRYFDFTFGNDYLEECQYPTFYNATGQPLLKGSDDLFDNLTGCHNSEFDQYGDANPDVVYPDWELTLAKAALVQDRLREWMPSVREKLQTFSCIMIASLDIDGFRFDKAGEVTVDAFADYSDSIRTCASNLGKNNFFLSGELTAGNDYASVYIGRGRQPEMRPHTISQAISLTNSSDDSFFIRAPGKSPVDSAAFHYSIHRSLERFLGLDGNISAAYDLNVSFVEAWNGIVLSNDLVNTNTGNFDPRHMLGTTNQDNFRWPAIEQGVEKMLLGQFITTLLLPGVPLLFYGEEQAFYITDSTNESYLFGRQPISSSLAWQTQGCYGLGSSNFYQFPVEDALTGCEDEGVSLDHRDPAHPIRNIIKAMYYLREQYPVLNDGYYLQALSKQTHNILLPGSNGTVTETGVWSVLRDQLNQNLTVNNPSGVWIVYQNENEKMQYTIDCSSSSAWLIAPFEAGTTLKNLLAPFDEVVLTTSSISLDIDNSTKTNGCLSSLDLVAFDFKAYVPKAQWTGPPPMMTKFSPGHDARLLSNVSEDGTESVQIEFQFSVELDCDQITNNLLIISSTVGNTTATIDSSSVSCQAVGSATSTYVGEIASVWSWSGTLVNVANGVHSVSVKNASSADGSQFTNSIDRVMFRVGQANNPLVFPRTANYPRNVLTKDSNTGDLSVVHTASGADMWRYSTNWASTWSNWTAYRGGTSELVKLPWSGTRKQQWSGDHVILQYWNAQAGSSHHIQHTDVGRVKDPARRFPHLFGFGEMNSGGTDSGAKDEFSQVDDRWWKLHVMTEWPSTMQVNVWGVNPDNRVDRTFIMGDVANNSVLNRLPPDSLSGSILNISTFPPSPHIAYSVEIDDATLGYRFVPVGSRTVQCVVYALLWFISPLAGAASVWIYMGAFYGVKFNKSGVANGLKKPFLNLPFFKRHDFEKIPEYELAYQPKMAMSTVSHKRHDSAKEIPTISVTGGRRTVLIATIEYDIEDWKIKIKIGGLGVMAQLMGKNLPHQDLIWVVPCVGDVEYPVDPEGTAEPMFIIVLGKLYEVKVQYHQLRNITYVLLDAPVFRQQTKSDPYPPRMDDLDSAIYYSAWNACIAETVKRFPVDIYHINDYHGAAAPLYLLPDTIPCCLSLHNAEFQGLWPMRNAEECTEVSKVFNLHLDTVSKYVQFGEVFNLLHAGASYLRVHQKGFGAVGVSNKYGDRSYARYPIFWGLKEIGKLPNPDPSDTEPWDPEAEARQVISVDPAYEASRGDLRRQAQEWAQLEINPKAELFVFVGRWSVQKGVDLIADVFPAMLEKHTSVQLICIGPVIDLYGKFAALKLGEMMKKYPGRVYSKPEFTALPPFIFTGAEFALIPSRDEPFGLVAVEFGRKGALGVGARVGGLGQMPGWWYTVESTTPKHLQKQFKSAIEKALSSKDGERAMMRAKSAKQRFPVARWVEDLDHLQSQSIRVHHSERREHGKRDTDTTSLYSRHRSESDVYGTPAMLSRNVSQETVRIIATPPSEDEKPPETSGLTRKMSLGLRKGPGHVMRGGIEPPAIHIDQIVEDDNEQVEVTISTEEADSMIRRDHNSRVCQEHQACRDLQADQMRMENPPLQPDETYSRNRRRTESLISVPDETHPQGRQRAESLIPITEDDRGRRRAESLISVTDDNRPRSLSPFPRGVLTIDELHRRKRASSVLSVADVSAGRTDFKLQKVDATFLDSTGEYYRSFEAMLSGLKGKNSENELCIEEFLVKSEKEWATDMRETKMGRGKGRPHSPSPSMFHRKRGSLPSGVLYKQPIENPYSDDTSLIDTADESLLSRDYQRPSFVKRWMTIRLFDWPLYSLLLALGQILAANSYQITLIIPGSSQSNVLFYVLGAIYIVATSVWWYLFRRIPSYLVLSAPFIIYTLSFFCVSIASIITNPRVQEDIHYLASGLYISASASGSLFFALNFGDEGGAPITSWVYRACIIQGTQSIYTALLFYWGHMRFTGPYHTTTASVAIPMAAAALLFVVSIILFTGLPTYYRQSPGTIPNFYRTIVNRKIILWFLLTVAIQNFFLSAPYGRNWDFLWTSKYAKPWMIGIMTGVFFVGVWAAILLVFARLSKGHTWILPIFGVGLGAPRWAQMFWGISGFGLWLPWMPGGPVAGALAARSVWLWLGVLDAIQGVGFGMMLLQTLTRFHTAATLMAAQALGASITLIAKACAPDKNGPADVFPDLSAGIVQTFNKPWFWVALCAQLIIPIGFIKFFRKEQLSKP